MPKPQWPDKPGPCKSEHMGKVWQHVYSHGKPALQNHATGEVCIPSKAYVSRHHPQGPWNS